MKIKGKNLIAKIEEKAKVVQGKAAIAGVRMDFCALPFAFASTSRKKQ